MTADLMSLDRSAPVPGLTPLVARYVQIRLLRFIPCFTALVIAGASCAPPDNRRGPRVRTGDQLSQTTTMTRLRPDTVVYDTREGIANAINDAGVVAGSIRTANGTKCAVIWKDGSVRGLPVPAGRIGSDASGINAAGMVVGSTLVPTAGGGDRDLPFIWGDRGGHDIHIKQASRGAAADINDSGVVVGTFDDINGVASAFLWTASGVSRIGMWSGAPFEQLAASAINRSGVIVGYAFPRQPEESDPGGVRVLGSAAWKRESGVVRELSVGAGAFERAASDVNDNGEVVGRLELQDSERGRGFVWRSGRVVLLAIPRGWSDTDAIAINNRGDIIGTSRDPSSELRAVIWESGRFRALPELAETRRSRPTDINNRGQGVGYAQGLDGRVRAVLWEGRSVRELKLPEQSLAECDAQTAASR